MKKDPAAGPSLLDRFVAAFQRRIGLNETIAREWSAMLLDELREDFAGDYIGPYYIGKGLGPEAIAARNASILAEFNGTNADECSRKYGVSARQLYNIVGRRAR